MTARSIQVRGVVQGVGFRPFVYRLARANDLAGWVANQESGVSIRLEGEEPGVTAFLRELTGNPPPAARIANVEISDASPAGLTGFTIRDTERSAAPTARISPDLPVCDECLREMRDRASPRFGYAYINCTNCGPRYSVIQRLPYDRAHTTMAAWPMDTLCASQYSDASDRRFHAQPVACPGCGPRYLADVAAIAQRLRAGDIVAVKGIGGYHLACDARNGAAVQRLRQRKYRKERPFALMPRSIEAACEIAQVNADARALLMSSARPIVLVPKRYQLEGIAPDNDEYGVILPYAPVHHLLFDNGAPELLVMTSANRSSEPLAYRDDEAHDRLSGIADAFLVGERPIARRVDDSIARVGPFGPMILRRSRGYAPGAVTILPSKQPILALGADLKNTITIVIEGQAFVSQHIGDLDDYDSRQSFQQTIRDLTSMYDVSPSQMLVAYDAHPEYFSSALASAGARSVRVQHHRAHIASVLAERQCWEKRIIGVSFDGTGYGDDGAIWGGEFFVGDLTKGLIRAAHLRPARLAGGDAAARSPVQAAAAFLAQLEGLTDVTAAPFRFPARYQHAAQLIARGIRTFETTSVGRLFDTVAALVGFTRDITFEGQAAIWLEQLARSSGTAEAYPFPLVADELDFRPLLAMVVEDRSRGRDAAEIARAFHNGVAAAICHTACRLRDLHGAEAVVCSGGVFQNRLLIDEIIARADFSVWWNAAVPPNDGGISLGQAAIAAFAEERHA